jgi:hypothetical protein
MRLFDACVIIFFVLFVLALCGCQEKLTRGEWDARYKPKDVNEASAMVILEAGRKEADQKMKRQSAIDRVQLICIVGAIASIAAIILGTSGLKGIGLGALLTCIAGFALIQFYTTYPMVVAYIGGGIALTAGTFSIWTHKKALAEVVTNVEGIKSVASNASVTLPIVITSVGSILKNQSPATKSLVAGIRKKINGATK